MRDECRNRILCGGAAGIICLSLTGIPQQAFATEDASQAVVAIADEQATEQTTVEEVFEKGESSHQSTGETSDGDIEEAKNADDEAESDDISRSDASGPASSSDGDAGEKVSENVAVPEKPADFSPEITEGQPIDIADGDSEAVQATTDLAKTGASDMGRMSPAAIKPVTSNAKTVTGISAKAVSKSAAAAMKPSVSYQAHVQDVGWQKSAKDGAIAGTTGQEKRLEGIRITISGASGASIQYQAHVQDIGWQGWRSDGQLGGTTGQARRLEALRIRLAGALSDSYSIQYRAHVQNIGWQDWVSDGDMAGTTGRSLRIEALQIRLVSLDQGSVQVHVQDVGWQGRRASGETAGTTGQAKRVEAIRVWAPKDAHVIYMAHVQNDGWQKQVMDGAVAGTTGQAKRLEAIQIRMSGADSAKKYDVYYRVHIQNAGWLDWAVNGETAGSVGEGLRIEAIQVRFLPKGSAAPGSTNAPQYYDYAIMGSSRATRNDMVRCYNDHVRSAKKSYPRQAYAGKGAASISDFVNLIFKAADSEGVRPDVVFSQAMLETGWLQFGGDVKAEQCNFAGIGATGGGNPGNSFSSVYEGLLAQVQHLKAYASTKPLKNTCVDPRFKYVSRGCAPTIDGLTKKWASNPTYARDIKHILNPLDNMS